MVDLFFALGELFIVMAYVFRNILVLRVFTVIGTTIYAMGAFFLGYSAPGMKVLIAFSTLVISINLVQIFKLILDKLTIVLPENIRWLYHNMFSSFTPRDFGKLYALSEKRKYVKGQVIVIQNQPVTELIAIKSGNCLIIKNNQTVAQLGPGFFVGEMSFLTGKRATATTSADSDMECVVWKHDVLHQLEKINVNLSSSLKREISFNLIKKIDYPKKRS